MDISSSEGYASLCSKCKAGIGFVSEKKVKDIGEYCQIVSKIRTSKENEKSRILAEIILTSGKKYAGVFPEIRYYDKDIKTNKVTVQSDSYESISATPYLRLEFMDVEHGNEVQNEVDIDDQDITSFVIKCVKCLKNKSGNPAGSQCLIS